MYLVISVFVDMKPQTIWYSSWTSPYITFLEHLLHFLSILSSDVRVNSEPNHLLFHSTRNNSKHVPQRMDIGSIKSWVPIYNGWVDYDFTLKSHCWSAFQKPPGPLRSRLGVPGVTKHVSQLKLPCLWYTCSGKRKCFETVCMYVCMDGRMDGWMDAWMYVWMHVCLYVCTYLRTYVCM